MANWGHQLTNPASSGRRLAWSFDRLRGLCFGPLCAATVLTAGPMARPALADEAADSAAPAARPRSLRELIDAGNLNEALVVAERILSVHPDDDETRATRARLLYWLGRWDEAEAEVEALLGRHAGDLELIELRARILLAQGRLAASRRDWMALRNAGDRRPEVTKRVLDLSLALGDAQTARQAMAEGAVLDDEQQLALAKVEHPWLIEVGSQTALLPVRRGTTTESTFWQRVDLAASYRFGLRATVLAGVSAEQRDLTSSARRGLTPRLEWYGALGRWEGMAHVSSGLGADFLPILDLRTDWSVPVADAVGLGLYARYAQYGRLSQPTRQLVQVAPSVIWHLGSVDFAPGWMFLIQDDGTLLNTGLLKLRWQQQPRTAWFLWNFLGPDPNWVERVGTSPGLGYTALVGLDHWLTPRWGVRASLSRLQPIDDFEPFTEFSLSLRGRL